MMYIKRIWQYRNIQYDGNTHVYIKITAIVYCNLDTMCSRTRQLIRLMRWGSDIIPSRCLWFLWQPATYCVQPTFSLRMDWDSWWVMKCWICSTFLSQKIVSCLHNRSLWAWLNLLCEWFQQQSLNFRTDYTARTETCLKKFISSIPWRLHVCEGYWLVGQITNPCVVWEVPVFWLHSVWLWPQESKHTDMSSYKKEL